MNDDAEEEIDDATPYATSLLNLLRDEGVVEADVIGVARAGMIFVLLHVGQSDEVRALRDRMQSEVGTPADLSEFRVARFRGFCQLATRHSGTVDAMWRLLARDYPGVEPDRLVEAGGAPSIVWK